MSEWIHKESFFDSLFLFMINYFKKNKKEYERFIYENNFSCN